MVKELEITDWEPLEIAGMIHNEITRLVPSWNRSFTTYDEDEDNDDNSPHHPFYASSSLSSSQASLPGIFLPHDPLFHHTKTLTLDADDEGDETSSQSSSCSDNYSNLKYYSANDEDAMISCIGKIHQKCTRFGPEGSMIGLDSRSKPRQRMVRTGSLVDIRSQLLHRSLVEEINKRRMFKTVGAVEHIGYQQPGKSVDRRRRDL